ncbi:hypothetical protein LCGC14_2035820 [marine sediment metagenome]|uniref:Elp3/MiaA/NifB-like radical SAM core domain-containing protein n=1 Tax=marine sediment metagenome TaxID=412755 RepID=A0A0F9H6U0_9ZZZZ
MHFLLIQPKYYSRYPPLGLLKISSYLKKQGHTTEFIKGKENPKCKPDEIYVTSLFTYAWEIVHKTVKFYKDKFPQVKITLGGLYASLMPNHAKKSQADIIHTGLYDETEDLMPDYSLVPKWETSIIFSSRGCIRKCGYCAVPILEPNFVPQKSIKNLIYKKHKKVVIWDNNFLASPFVHNILDELIELNLEVDFNHGLDARMIDLSIAKKLKKLRVKYVRMAYDLIDYREEVKKAIDILETAGYRGRELFFYTLHNYNDTPEDFFIRHQDIMKWGVVSYPMRYIPLKALNKNKFISKNWTAEELEMIADARRVIGVRGAFPPYKGLQLKILNAKNFYEAFELRPVQSIILRG